MKEILKNMSKKLTLLQSSIVRLSIGLILLALIALVTTLAGKCYAQTPTKDQNTITISEAEARKALKYKADAEYFWAISMQKDSILQNQKIIISKQKKKLFWRRMIIVAETALVSYLILRK